MVVEEIHQQIEAYSLLIEQSRKSTPVKTVETRIALGLSEEPR